MAIEMSASTAARQLAWPATVLVAAVVLGAAATYAPAAALGAAIGALALMLVARDANNALLLSLLILPFIYSPLMEINLFDVPGMKIPNLALAATLAICLVKGGMLRSSDRIERRAMIVLGIYFLLFTFEFGRSVLNLDLFHRLVPTQFDDEPVRYILSFYVRNALFLVPFVFILKHMKGETDRVLFGLSLAIFIVSCVMVFAVSRDTSVLGQGRHAIEALCERYLGFHYNTVGTMYLTVGPLLVYLATTRNLFGIVNLILAILVILVLQSRSTLVVFVLTSAITLILIKRTTLLVAGTVAVGLASGFWLGPTVTALLSIGIDQGSVYSADELFTGRVQYIWVPLFKEWLADPMLLLFGAGRYGILTSPLWRSGQILKVLHAHNAFLDFFLDSGAILTLLLIGAVIAGLLWSWRAGRAMKNPLFWALFMCVIAYLIGTLTERQFFPTYDNILLFPVVAVLINVARRRLADRLPVAPQHPAMPAVAAAPGGGSGTVRMHAETKQSA